MGKSKVVALLSDSLFSAGVLKRLEQFQDQLELIKYNATTDAAIDLIESHQPDTIITDTDFELAADRCSLDELMHRFPEMKIIRLDPQREGFEVLRNEQHSAQAVRALLDVITGSHDRS